jgi:hypothetical protein
MKPFLFLFLPIVAALSLGLATSCTTMYDANGRPVDVITPEGAAVAALAAGVIGYAIGENQNGHHGYHGHGGHGYGYGHGGYGYYGGGYRGYGGYCR